MSFFIIRSLRPTENPYDVLQKDLASRKVFLSSKAIQMRVRRLERKVRAGQHMTWHQILQHQYTCFKYFSGMNLWLSRFKGFPGFPRGGICQEVPHIDTARDESVTKPCCRGRNLKASLPASPRASITAQEHGGAKPLTITLPATGVA